MKNRGFILSFLILLITNFAFAQATSKKVSYQAVVRNAANELVTNESLSVEITILNANNVPQYRETHASVSTNQNGLLWLWVGEGTPTLGTLDEVVWKDATIQSVFTLPGGNTVTQNTPVTAMPYAYYADEVDTLFLQDYLTTHNYGNEDYVTHEQLDDTLSRYTTTDKIDTLLGVYFDSTKVKKAIHDTADAIRAAIPASQVNADWNATGGPAEILNKPDLSVYATNAHLNDTLNSFATKDTLSAYATKDTLANYATINALKDSLTRYVDKDKLTDTLDSYYTKNNIDSKLNDYEKKSELCGDVKECIKDTLGKYTTSNNIDTLLGAYFDSTQVKSAIHDTADVLRGEFPTVNNGQITIKVDNQGVLEENTFGVNQANNQTISITIPQNVAVNDGQLTIITKGDTTRFTANQAINDTVNFSNYVTKDTMSNFLTINGLCDSIVKCDVIKDMRDSLDNAFDTLSYYYTSKKINDTLKAYFDTTLVQALVHDSLTQNVELTIKSDSLFLKSGGDIDTVKLPAFPEQVKSDWKETNTSSAAYILNKPVIKDSVNIVVKDSLRAANSAINKAIDTIALNVVKDTLKAYYDTTRVKALVHDSIGNGKITIQKNGATITDGSFNLNQKTDQTINITVPTQTSELTNNSNLAYTTGNTFSGTHDFTASGTTITVPSNEGAIKRPVPTTTPAPTCDNMNAVNVCDLLAVFDSLTKRIDALQQELDELKNSTPPVFNSLTFTDITSTTMKVKAQFTSQITPITSYKFCYSTNSDMSSPTCVDTTASEITLKGLDPYQRYYITVTASNIAGSTTGSGNERTYADKPEASTIETTPSPSGFEITVSNLHFNGPSEGTIQVLYKQGTDCAEDEEGFTAVSNPIEMVNGSTYYRRVTNLEAETPYCVLVKLSNEDSTKVYSLNVVSGAALSLSIEIDTISTISICEDDTVVITFTAKLNYSEYKNDYNYQFAYSTSQSEQRVKYISRTDSSFKMAFFTQPSRTTYECTITANAVHKTYGSEDNLRADSVITVNKITHPTFTICNDRQIINFTRMDEGVTSVAWGDGATDNNPSVASSHLYDAPGFYNLEVSRGSCTTTKSISVNQNLTPCIVSTPHIDNSEYTPETGGLEVAVDDTVYSVNDQNGHSYQVTQIGTQCWMKSNLRTTKLSDGTKLSYGTDESNGNLTLDAAVKYYYKPTAAHTNTNYNFDYSRYNEERDGLYYNWTAAMNGASSSNSVPSNVQGICPKGWHVPSRAEWDILIGYAETTYGTSTGYANQLSGGCEWEPINELVNSEGNPGYYANANRNVTGFSALPVGCIDYPSTFINNTTSGARATFWTTETGGTFNRPYVKIFYNIHNYVGEECSATANMAMSVRCLRDADGPVTPTTSCSVTNVGTNEEAGENNTITAVRDVQNHEYGVVEIGGLCWMKENLRSTQYSSNLAGTLPTLTPIGSSYVNGVAYYGYPNGNSENEETYGLLYSGNAAMAGSYTEGYQGICPDGWRLPSKSELEALMNSSDLSLFNVVYAGGYDKQNPTEFGSEANLWSSTYKDDAPSNTYLHYLYIPSAGNPLIADDHALENSYSVRCVRNVEGGGETSQNPTVATGDPTNVTSTSATLNATITPAGNETIMTRGFQLKVSGGDYDPLMFSGTDDVYSVTVDTLSAGVTYVYRAFISYGSSYTPAFGEEVEFTTSSVEPAATDCGTVTDADGNTYNTVVIGSQCWMKENLRTTKYSDNTDITTYYDYSTSGIPLERRGYLYDWNVTMNQSGSHDICPNGWHVPSLDEWESLNVSEYQCDGNIARAMAANTDWYVSTTQCQECEVCYDLNNNNSSGFSAIPAGFHIQSGFDEAGSSANFWTSSINNSNNEPRYVIIDIWSGYRNTSEPATNGYSVRCVRDGEASVTTSAAVNISTTGAWLRGNVVARGNTIVEKGFYWKATEGGTYVKVTSTGGTLTSRLSGLTANTSYTYYAFATTADGTVNGEEVVFTTSEEPSVSNCGTVTDVDGNTYNTVMIGSQCWMKENLRTKGALTSFENVTNPSVTPFYYQPTTSDFAEYTVPTYGLYYNRSAALNNYDGTGVENPSNNIQGICPTGWHIPSKSEWQTLKVATDNSPCKLAGSSDWSGNDWGDDDVSPGNYGYPYRNQAGFTALPSGRLDVSSGTMNNTYRPHDHALFWSSSFDDNATYYLRLWYYDVPFYFETCGNDYAFPVRCVRDAE